MSKLPKAPLIEVIFELRWDINTKNDLLDFQYLHGDLYSAVKDRFPFRENLVPPEVPFEALRGVPVFRFRKSNGNYPLIQIGPGLITLNTINQDYVWEAFRESVFYLVNVLNNINPKFSQLNLSPSLIYIDYFSLNESEEKSHQFINNNFNIAVENGFLNQYSEKVLETINYMFNYRIGENVLNLNLADGIVNNIPGLLLNTKVIGKKSIYIESNMYEWIDVAHTLISDSFKSIVKENLYSSFN